MNSNEYIDLAYTILARCYSTIDYGILGESRKSVKEYLSEYFEFAGEDSLIQSCDYESLDTNLERSLFWHSVLICLSSIDFASRVITNDKIYIENTDVANLIEELNNIAQTQKDKNFINNGIFDLITYDLNIKKRLLLCCTYFYRNETTTLGINGLDGLNIDSHLGYLLYLEPKLSIKYGYHDPYITCKSILRSEDIGDIQMLLDSMYSSIEFYSHEGTDESEVVHSHLNYIYELLTSIYPLEKKLRKIESIEFYKDSGVLKINGTFLDSITEGSKQHIFLKLFFQNELKFNDCIKYKAEFDLTCTNDKLTKSDIQKLDNLRKQIFSKVEEAYGVHHSHIFKQKVSRTFSLIIKPELKTLLKIH